MIILTIAEIKRQLRFPDVTPDADEDPYLTDIEAAAVDYVQDYIGQSLPFESDSEHSDPWVPNAIKQALLILVADFYENRQKNVIGASVATLSTVQDLLHFKRIGLGI